MPISFTFKSNFNAKKILDERLKRMLPAFAAALEEEAGQIVKRTQGGKDIEGGAFASYTSAYAKQKYTGNQGGKNAGGFTKRAKARANIQGAFSNFGRVNLTVTGQLLQAIRTAVKRVGNILEGRIFILTGRSNRGGGAQTNHDIARGLSKKRQFFGLSRKQITAIAKRINKA